MVSDWGFSLQEYLHDFSGSDGRLSLSVRSESIGDDLAVCTKSSLPSWFCSGVVSPYMVVPEIEDRVLQALGRDDGLSLSGSIPIEWPTSACNHPLLRRHRHVFSLCNILMLLDGLGDCQTKGRQQRDVLIQLRRNIHFMRLSL